MARVLFWLACLKIIQLSLTYLRIDVRTQIEGIGEIEKMPNTDYYCCGTGKPCLAGETRERTVGRPVVADCMW